MPDEAKEDEKPKGPIVPQESVTVPLSYPVKFGETTIDCLTFRPLTAKDMRRSSANLTTLMAQETVLEYAGYLSGKPGHIIDLLSGPDAINVIAAVSGFFLPSHGTGPK